MDDIVNQLGGWHPGEAPLEDEAKREILMLRANVENLKQSKDLLDWWLLHFEVSIGTTGPNDKGQSGFEAAALDEFGNFDDPIGYGATPLEALMECRKKIGE